MDPETRKEKEEKLSSLVSAGYRTGHIIVEMLEYEEDIGYEPEEWGYFLMVSGRIMEQYNRSIKNLEEELKTK